MIDKDLKFFIEKAKRLLEIYDPSAPVLKAKAKIIKAGIRGCELKLKKEKLKEKP
jgi:hypothetical protein